MNPKKLANLLYGHQRQVLIGLLVMFHLTLIAGESVLGIVCWWVDVGLFLIWQPFVEPRVRVKWSSLLLLVFMVLTGSFVFGWWLLAAWTLILMAVLGGRVFVAAPGGVRLFYLVALTYLLLVFVAWVIPNAVPVLAQEVRLVDQMVRLSGPILFLVMLFVPSAHNETESSQRIIDFVYSLFLLLLILVLVLGAFAYMVIQGAHYFDALWHALLFMALMLLMVSWAWRSSSTSAGLGAMLTRYVLSEGMPVELWLEKVALHSKAADDSFQFLASMVAELCRIPWVKGCRWGVGASEFRDDDVEKKKRHESSHDCFSEGVLEGEVVPVLLDEAWFHVYTNRGVGGSMQWHIRILLQLVHDHFTVRARNEERQHVEYLRAVYETGSRLTHDVKNLLQILRNLCFALDSAGPGGDKDVLHMLKKHLPKVAYRLEGTLSKLQQPVSVSDPGEANDHAVPLHVWFEDLAGRYAGQHILFDGALDNQAMMGVNVPRELFDFVADTFLQNALSRRLECEHVAIVCSVLGRGEGFFVENLGGGKVPEAVLSKLFKSPVDSATGFGIGLYQASQQARQAGYLISLTDNEVDRVRFQLSRNSA